MSPRIPHTIQSAAEARAAPRSAAENPGRAERLRSTTDRSGPRGALRSAAERRGAPRSAAERPWSAAERRGAPERPRSARGAPAERLRSARGAPAVCLRNATEYNSFQEKKE